MELPLWIEFFDDLQNVRGRSQNTVMAYRRDLELWREYKKSDNSVAGFYDFMKQHDLSTRSQARNKVRAPSRFGKCVQIICGKAASPGNLQASVAAIQNRRP